MTQSDVLRLRVHENAAYFREGLTRLGFQLLPGAHPIIPIMTHDAVLAQQMAAQLLHEGVYVVGFFFPVVPRGAARIRTQISAAHTIPQLDRALIAFEKVGRRLKVID